MTNYLIQVIPQGSSFEVRISEETGFNQREGASYSLLGVNVGPDKDEAIGQLVREVFPCEELS